MPDLKWNVLLTRPWTALKIFFSGSWRSILVLLGRIVFPFRARRLSLRTQLVRAWVIAAHFTDSDAFCSEPWGHRCQEVTFETPLVAGVDGPGHGDNGDASEGSHTTTAPTTTAASSPNRPKDVGGWIIPTTNFGELKNKDAILMYAHGGGYAIGHGLQNLSDFQRWIRKAKPFGQEWAVVSVKYRESPLRIWSFKTFHLVEDRTREPQSTVVSVEN